MELQHGERDVMWKGSDGLEEDVGDLTIPLHTPDFPVQKPVSPSSIKKPNQTKQNKNTNKQTDKNKTKNKNKNKNKKKNNVDRISCFQKRK